MRHGGEKRGSAADRRRRKQWLLETFGDGNTAWCFLQIHDACPGVVTFETVQADRFCPGGSYRRGNIQPACEYCNNRKRDKWLPSIKRQLVLAR